MKHTLLMLPLVLGGCASVVSGQTDHVNIDSEPRGALCAVYQAGESLGEVRTPQTLAVERRDSTLIVRCEKDGETAEEREPSGLNAWSLANLVLFPPFGTLVGFLIDWSSGASRGYDDITVTFAEIQPND